MSEDMVGGREGRLAADVGAGGGYRRGESGYDLPRHWMIRDSKADCIESSRNDVRYAGRPLDDDRQLAGPEGGSKLYRRTSGTRRPNSWKSSIPETNNGSGIDCPRSFTSKTRCTADSSRAAAAMPYRVSVGMATTPPSASAETALSMAPDGVGCCSRACNLTEI